MTSISGERGVGKTLFLAEKVYNKSQEGYLTVTNFTHTHSALDCSSLTPVEFWQTVSDLIAFKEAGFEPWDIHPSFWHTGVYIAIDEGTLYLSPDQQKRMQQNNPEAYDRMLNLLAQARKYDVEIDYVVQDPAKIGKDFRRYTELYIRLRWLLKMRRKILIQHPSGRGYRRELRNFLDVIKVEVHELDNENPVFNYKKVPDKNGDMQWSETSTVIDTEWKLTGRFKKHIYRMFNSYQPMAVNTQNDRTEFPFLEKITITLAPFKREKFPTFKKWIRFFTFGKISIPNIDQFLPPKYRLEKIILPKVETKVAIAEVETQAVKTITVKELQKAIARAYAKRSSRSAATPADLPGGAGPPRESGLPPAIERADPSENPAM